MTSAMLSPSLVGIFVPREGDVVSFSPNQYGVISSSLRVLSVFFFFFCVVICLTVSATGSRRNGPLSAVLFCVYFAYLLFI